MKDEDDTEVLRVGGCSMVMGGGSGGAKQKWQCGGLPGGRKVKNERAVGGRAQYTQFYA